MLKANEKRWQSLMEVVRTCAPYSSSSRVTLWFEDGTPVAQLVNTIRRMAEENQMVIEWGYCDKSPLFFDDEGKDCVLASVYYGRSSEGASVCLNVRLPGVARELCEHLWGPSVVRE